MADPAMALAHGPGYLMVLDVCLRDAAALARFLVNPLTTQAFIGHGLMIFGNRAFSGKGLIDLGVPVAVLSAARLFFLGRATAS
jgi:hypothetical protein